jgi:hypothetical protein
LTGLTGAATSELEQFRIAAKEAGRGVDDHGVLGHGPIVRWYGDRCLSSVLGLLGRGLAPGKEQIQLAASLVKNLSGFGDVGGISGTADLPDRGEQLEGLVAEIAMVAADGACCLCPGCGTGGELGCLFTARVGQLEHAAPAVRFDRADEPFVLELLEGGVDRSGTRPPGTVAAALELLDDLVPVRRLLGKEHEDRGTDVASGGTPARAERLAESTGTAEAAGELGCIEGRPPAPMPTASAVLEVLADVVVEAGRGLLAERLLAPGVVGMFSGHVDSLQSG